MYFQFKRSETRKCFIAIAFQIFCLEFEGPKISGGGTELDWEHQVCADGVNLLGKNMNTVKKNTELLLDAAKEVGLEVITMFMSCHQTTGQNYYIKVTNKF
jgi:hypothetical protein